MDLILVAAVFGFDYLVDGRLAVLFEIKRKVTLGRLDLHHEGAPPQTRRVTQATEPAICVCVLINGRQRPLMELRNNASKIHPN